MPYCGILVCGFETYENNGDGAKPSLPRTSACTTRISVIWNVPRNRACR